MKEIVRVDGVGVYIDGKSLVLAVHDANGMHSTYLSDEGAEALMGGLVVGRRFARKAQTGSYFKKEER